MSEGKHYGRKAIFILGLLFCVFLFIYSILDDGLEGGTTQAIHKFNTTDLYLFPAVTDVDMTTFLDSTEYLIWRNGHYLGTFDNNRLSPINFSTNTSDKSLTFVPGDELEILVRVNETFVRNEYFQVYVPDQKIEYITPTLRSIDEYSLGFKITRYDESLELTNWTVETLPYEEIYLDLKLDKYTPWTGLFCNHDPYYLKLEVHEGHRDLPLYSEYYYATGYTLNSEYIHITIYTKDIENSTLIQCELADTKYYLNKRTSEPEYAYYGYKEGDLGIPNKKFNITLKRHKK